MSKDGGSAFPEIETYAQWCEKRDAYHDRTYSQGGMTLRDYFAAKAMSALMISCPQNSAEWVARQAYARADAMIAQR